MLDFRKMAVILSVLSITAPTMTTLASAQERALSEGERHGLAACLVKCPDGNKACNNRCISKSQTGGVGPHPVSRGFSKRSAVHRPI